MRIEGSTHTVKFHCEFTLKKGVCGKRQLRQPFRTEVAEMLKYKTAERYRIDEASKLMIHGEKEAPIIPKASVLNVAKHEYMQSLQLDKNPIIAISKMKRIGDAESKLAIRFIGYDPFYVMYWSNYQSLVYKKYASNEIASIKIDSTGKLVSRLKKDDGTLGPHIFLYLIVINCSAGQFTVNQMISEAQDTGTIQNWMTQWSRSGIPSPKETVSDAARALQTAIVRTFTGYLTIEEYCDVFLNDKLPICYVRTDVAHVLHIYAKLLQPEHRLVKKFYMAVTGKIILSRNLESVKKIIFALLIVSTSETEGGPSDLKMCDSEKKIFNRVSYRTMSSC